ncbi:MAG TPA: class I SAM-dependent methyltransferase [Bacteroidales bacterium]|nr:class I SAM-dependent methyltransferase [Bacteroidales bacterium]
MKRINHCRVCHHEFFETPLFRYENMPKSAQNFPDAASLGNDKGIDLEVCQCSGCGIVQLSNDPVPYYREVIRAAAFSEEMKQFRLHQFEQFAHRYSLENKKIIEIGCGRGEYLSLMKKFIAQAYGIEYSPVSVNLCKESGLKVQQGYIDAEKFILQDAPFNAFFILSFLEHMPDINTALRGIAHNLTDDAVGLIEVPNFDMILRKNLFSEFISDHLFYFTAETLSSLLAVNGFQVLECKAVWHDYILSAVVRKRRPVDMSDFSGFQSKLKDELFEFIGRHQDVAIWGAGHQALTVISLAGLSGKIKYVVDSAPFKQNKYTPASHIPIVAPEMLRANKVDAVIIMAAAYSDEIAGFLMNKYSKEIAIAILRDYGLEKIN